MPIGSDASVHTVRIVMTSPGSRKINDTPAAAIADEPMAVIDLGETPWRHIAELPSIHAA